MDMESHSPPHSYSLSFHSDTSLPTLSFHQESNASSCHSPISKPIQSTTAVTQQNDVTRLSVSSEAQELDKSSPEQDDNASPLGIYLGNGSSPENRNTAEQCFEATFQEHKETVLSTIQVTDIGADVDTFQTAEAFSTLHTCTLPTPSVAPQEETIYYSPLSSPSQSPNLSREENAHSHIVAEQDIFPTTQLSTIEADFSSLSIHYSLLPGDSKKEVIGDLTQDDNTTPSTKESKSDECSPSNPWYDERALFIQKKLQVLQSSFTGNCSKEREWVPKTDVSGFTTKACQAVWQHHWQQWPQNADTPQKAKFGKEPEILSAAVLSKYNNWMSGRIQSLNMQQRARVLKLYDERKKNNQRKKAEKIMIKKQLEKLERKRNQEYLNKYPYSTPDINVLSTVGEFAKELPKPSDDPDTIWKLLNNK